MFYNFFKFIYLFWERERAQAEEGQREKERENPKQALPCQHRARRGARSQQTVRSAPEPKPSVRCWTDWAAQVHFFFFLNNDQGRRRLAPFKNMWVYCVPCERDRERVRERERAVCPADLAPVDSPEDVSLPSENLTTSLEDMLARVPLQHQGPLRPIFLSVLDNLVSSVTSFKQGLPGVKGQPKAHFWTATGF